MQHQQRKRLYLIVSLVVVDEESVLLGLEQATRAQQMYLRQKLQTPMEVIPSCARSGQDDGSTAYPLFLLKRELSVNAVKTGANRVGG
jgi:hypothetical protein